MFYSVPSIGTEQNFGLGTPASDLEEAYDVSLDASCHVLSLIHPQLGDASPDAAFNAEGSNKKKKKS